MFEDRDIRNLPSLRSAGTYVMAFLTANALPGSMVAVAKDRLERVIRLQSTAIRSQSMADGTRADLTLRRVTRIASIMRIDP